MPWETGHYEAVKPPKQSIAPRPYYSAAVPISPGNASPLPIPAFRR
ncbi:hypothetical protein AiwAL_14640 [Acidiphilium sp. AL]|nr:hypothetical protein [Acidiphilium sp. AL]MCU4161324.1 hypothetical protein [Acidiphilium sp. AL]